MTKVILMYRTVILAQKEREGIASYELEYKRLNGMILKFNEGIQVGNSFEIENSYSIIA